MTDFFLFYPFRAHTAAVLAEMDVRSRLDQRRRQKNTTAHHQYEDDDDDYYLEDSDQYDESERYNTPRVKHEPETKPDLRSRLSRRNDW